MMLPVSQTFLAAAAIFAGWCLIDWFEVRQPDYPKRIHEREWLVFLLPLPAFFVSWGLARITSPRVGWLQALITTLVAIPISLPLILIFGVWFHFWIGGKL